MQAPSLRAVVGCRLFSLPTLQQPANCCGAWSPLPPGNKGVLVQKLRCRCPLYPHPHQQAAPASAFGWARAVRNDALALGRHLYKQGENLLGGTELQKRCPTQARPAPERCWLAEASNVPLAPCSPGSICSRSRSSPSCPVGGA